MSWVVETAVRSTLRCEPLRRAHDDVEGLLARRVLRTNDHPCEEDELSRVGWEAGRIGLEVQELQLRSHGTILALFVRRRDTLGHHRGFSSTSADH
jgi:hypothetical protein